MEATDNTGTGKATPASDLKRPGVDRLHAPDHLVGWLAQFLEPAVPVGPCDYPRGTPEHARRVRDQARVYADRIWSEGWVSGGAHAAAYASPQYIVVGKGDALSGNYEVAMLRSPVKPEDYRPETCPQCGVKVTGARAQSPAPGAWGPAPSGGELLGGAGPGRPDRVILDPCWHRIRFIDDTGTDEGDITWP